MKIIKFRTDNFKNLSGVEIEPDENFNLIVGDNAQGKTNLLENMYILSGCKSFRNRSERNFFQYGKNEFSSFLEFEDMRRRQKIEYLSVKGAFSTEKSIKLNGVKLKNTQPLFEELKYVAFVPDDSEIITGSPENRRNFFDLCISDCHKNYVKILVSFYKALETRNKILRENENLDLIEVYNEEIVKYGTKIYNFRKEFTDNIKKYFTPLYAKITKNMEKVDIIYNSNITPDNYSEKLKLNKNRDLITKYTYFGVQRDDFDITVNGMTARNFASTGQCKSLALCLKLSQSEIFAEFSDENPIILLDDILAELDDSRRDLLYKIIQGSQVFITACNQNIEKYDKKFILSSGRLTGGAAP